MKSGTTSLAETLESDANFVFPCDKEPAVFNKSAEEYDNAIGPYCNAMNNAPSGSIVADASPQYTFREDDSVERALQIHGQNTCVVYVLRDPIARAWSHFQHTWRSGWKMRPTADQAFDEEPVLFTVSDYISRYRGWIGSYPGMFVYRFEDVIADPSKALSDIIQQTGAQRHSQDTKLSHSNPTELHGQLMLPGGVQKLARSIKGIPGVQQLYRSTPVTKLRQALTKSPTPPKPSAAALKRFCERIEPRCEMLYEELGWDASMHWDLEKTINKITQS